MVKYLGMLVACTFCAVFPAYGLTPTDRSDAEARVRSDVAQDLAVPWQPDSLAGRTCLDGRPVADFQGDIVEYWAQLECPYCGIMEPLQAQQQNAGVCIVVRHIPTRGYGEAMKKALAYEALKKFSVNAANLFWDKVVPKAPQTLPLPYEASLLSAFQEAAVDPDAFGEALGNNEDVMAAGGRISVTPTWVFAGIRFPACDFTAAQFPVALDLAEKARDGDKDALERVVTAITNGLMNEPMW